LTEIAGSHHCRAIIGPVGNCKHPAHPKRWATRRLEPIPSIHTFVKRHTFAPTSVEPSDGRMQQSSVKYPEAFDRQWKLPEFLQLDLPEIVASGSIFLQIQVGGCPRI
jgi:hypothetical protein